MLDRGDRTIVNRIDPAAEGTSAHRRALSKSKADILADAIRAEVATGSLSPGSLLPPEADLMKMHDVSRPSYREAIRLLESEGLLEVKRGVGGGTRVLQPNLAPLSRSAAVFLQSQDIRVESLFEARLVYEPAIVVDIAMHGNEAVLARLAEHAGAQRFSIQNRRKYHDHEDAFRRILIEGSSNPVVRLFSMMVDDIFIRHIENISADLPSFPFEEAHLRQGAAAKSQLIRAMAAGDTIKARRIWIAYLRQYARRLTAAMGRDSVITAYPRTLT